MSHQGKSHKLVNDAMYVQEILANTNKNSSKNKNQTNSSKVKSKNPLVDQVKQIATDATKLYTDDEIEKLLDENDGDVSAVVNHIFDAAAHRDTWTPVNRGKKSKESGQKAEDFQSVQSRGSGKRGRGDHPNRDLKNEDGSNASSSPQRFNRNPNQRHQNGEGRQSYHSREHDNNKRTTMTQNGSRLDTPETTSSSSEKQDQTNKPSHHTANHHHQQKSSRFNYHHRDATNDAAATKSDVASVETPTDLKKETEVATAGAVETKEQNLQQPREVEKKEMAKMNPMPTSRPVTKVFSYKEAVSKGIKSEPEKTIPAPVTAAAAKKTNAKDRKKINKDTKSAQQRDNSESIAKTTTETSSKNAPEETPSTESVAQSNLSDEQPQQSIIETSSTLVIDTVESTPANSASNVSGDLIQIVHQNFSQKKYTQTKNVILPQGIQEDSDICFGDFDNQGSSNNGPLDYQETPQDKSSQYMNADHLEINGGIHGMFPFVAPNTFVPQDQDGLQDFMRNRHGTDSSPSAAVATAPFIPMHMPFVPPFMHFMAQQMAAQQHHQQHIQHQQNQSPPASSSSSSPNQPQQPQYFEGQQFGGSRGGNSGGSNNTSNAGSPPTSGSSGTNQPSGASNLPIAGAPGSMPFAPYAQFYPGPYGYGSQQPFYPQPSQMGNQYAPPPPPQMYGAARFPMMNGPQTPYNHFMPVQPTEDSGIFPVMGGYPPYMGAVDGGMGYMPQGVVTPPGSTGNNSNNGASPIAQSPVISATSKQGPHGYSNGAYAPVMSKQFGSQDKSQMYSGERGHASGNGQRNNGNETMGGQNFFAQQFSFAQRGFGN